jgi:hypothetical protein
MSDFSLSGRSDAFKWNEICEDVDGKLADIFSEQLRERGFCVVDIGDAMVPEWEKVFRTAFLTLSDEEKTNAGKYRVENGLAVGYRRDETREFFETRLSGEHWATCDPKYTLGSKGESDDSEDKAGRSDIKLDYEGTVCALAHSLGDVGEWCISSISRHLKLDPSFLVHLTDLVDRQSVLPANSSTTPIPVREGHGRDISSSLLRVCYYPAGEHSASTNPSATNVAFGSHTDTSFITVGPCSSVAGLEVQDLYTGEWLRPEVSHGPTHVVIFAGEMLEAVTKHRYRACVHRVKSPQAGHRISCPFLIRCNGASVFRPSADEYVHPGGAAALRRLPDLEDMKMGLVQKILDLKRGRCVRKNDGTGDDWVLRAYEEHEQRVDSGDEDEDDEDNNDAAAGATAKEGARAVDADADGAELASMGEEIE